MELLCLLNIGELKIFVILIDYLLVVVMDFGIIYFGYVFVMRDDFKKDLLIIDVFYWCDVGFILFKILMIVLIDKNEKFVVFGFEV